MSERRNDRLSSDYREMMKIQDRPYLSWIATKGELPYAEEYLLTVKLRTYALSVRSGVHTVGVIDRCVIRITLWDSYPAVAPYVRMLNLPPVFHPDWYSKGTYSPHTPWDPATSLKDFVAGMLKTLRYDPERIDTTAPANYKALDWFLKNRDNDKLFPSDTTAIGENTEEEIAAIEKGGAFDEIVDSWGGSKE